MMKRARAYILTLLCILAAIPAAARQGRGFYAGLTSSFKGVGIEAVTERSEDKTESFCLTADFGGTLVRDIHDNPGIKFSWRVHYFLWNGISDRGFNYHIYIGPGLSAGYVRDYTIHNDRGFGVMTGICTNEGILIRFDRRPISVALEFSQELGFHMQRGAESGSLNMGLYRRGINSSYFPEIKIFIDLKRRTGK